MLTSKIHVPDQVMDLAKEAGVSLETDLCEVPENTNVVLPDGTIVTLPAKPDAATRYYGHVTRKTCSRLIVTVIAQVLSQDQRQAGPRGPAEQAGENEPPPPPPPPPPPSSSAPGGSGTGGGGGDDDPNKDKVKHILDMFSIQHAHVIQVHLRVPRRDLAKSPAGPRARAGTSLTRKGMGWQIPPSRRRNSR